MIRLVLLLGLAGCATDATPSPPSDAVAPAADGLDLLLATARACAGGAPHFGDGASGSPLVLTHAMVIRSVGRAEWSVHFTEEAPTTVPYGLQVRVDPARGTCGGDRMPRPAGEPGASAAGLVDAAWRCATALDDGRGVGGTPLVRDGITLTVRTSGDLVASVPETEARTRPTGRDVLLDRTGTGCRPAPMD
jgi:hypothetical protein